MFLLPSSSYRQSLVEPFACGISRDTNREGKCRLLGYNLAFDLGERPKTWRGNGERFGFGGGHARHRRQFDQASRCPLGRALFVIVASGQF